MNLDDQLDLIQEKQEENAKDILHEKNMRADIEYALEELGANEIVETLETISIKLSDYGHEYSVKDILDYLGLSNEN